MKSKHTTAAPQRGASFAGRRAIIHLFREYDRARRERDVAIERVSRFEETIRHLIDSLPPEDQMDFNRRFEELRAGQTAQGRGGEVFGKVIALFQQEAREEWSISEIRSELEKSGEAPDHKAVYNAVNYLAKSGRLRRIARGRYVMTDVGAGIEYDGFDDGTQRLTEHDV